MKGFYDLEGNIKNYKVTDYYLECNSNEFYYHYCSNKAFDSILDNSSFWFTNSDYTNDAMEIKEGKKIIVNCINEMEDLYSKTYRGILQDKIFSIIQQSYILCFCRSDNSSNMWREYAGIDGYCIKVNIFDMLNFKLQGDIEGEELEKYFWIYNGLVLYDDKIKNDKVKELLNHFGEVYKLFLIGRISEENFNTLEYYVTNHLAEFCLFCKKSGWESEKEYRIALLPKNNEANKFLKIRYNKYLGDIPYFNISFSSFKDLIQGVVLGPQNNKHIEEIEQKLKSGSYKHWDVKKVDLPIRF
ncbi:hypothetical protein CPJCM30710_31480 [Clostridium polyendosporum]|uniref:DUF2971 domain-containing protein n=1 Tax=Clostridium polyendosporum TaxID=69208 RepID=A0A919VHQ1_9CLOT|nr:DUF2971 domain-containing protein [Clostridium polyendosporum]GIM30482.1 hypothetical protein CPJCM30710_31480 [Clostridium polyendosporum]